MSDRAQVTRLLSRWKAGDAAAAEELMPLVYDELRRLARRQLAREGARHTLGTTALVHEAYINLVEHPGSGWEDRLHFFAIASRVMRRVLVWAARRRQTAKRGGGVRPVTLDDRIPGSDDNTDDVLALDEALHRLEDLDARLCRVVECRHFGGLSVSETAEALGVSAATVKRDWRTARAWLRKELGGVDA